jgi:hypothetical protein
MPRVQEPFDGAEGRVFVGVCHQVYQRRCLSAVLQLRPVNNLRENGEFTSTETGPHSQYVIRHPSLSSSTRSPLLAGRDYSAQGPGQANFSDSSGPLFNMYIKMTEEEDNKLADRWQKDADGILIFVSPYIGLQARIHQPTIL